jgi:hypothetical protein
MTNTIAVRAEPAQDEAFIQSHHERSGMTDTYEDLVVRQEQYNARMRRCGEAARVVGSSLKQQQILGRQFTFIKRLIVAALIVYSLDHIQAGITFAQMTPRVSADYQSYLAKPFAYRMTHRWDPTSTERSK